MKNSLMLHDKGRMTIFLEHSVGKEHFRFFCERKRGLISDKRACLRNRTIVHTKLVQPKTVATLGAAL